MMLDKPGKLYTYIHMLIYIYMSDWICIYICVSIYRPLQADEKRRAEEQRRHDALMASLSALTVQKSPEPPKVTENSSENQELKAMLQEALGKMKKMEKEMEDLKNDPGPTSDVEQDDEDAEEEDDDNQEFLTTQEGKTAPR